MTTEARRLANLLGRTTRLFLLFLALTCGLNAQPVTIDFDYPNPIPPFPSSWGLPWHEDGYVVGSSNRSDLAQIAVTLPPRGGSPPYPGVLNLFGFGRMASVTITNAASLAFDLLSVDVVVLGLGANSPTDYASITSSAGGVFDLLGIPAGTTVLFAGDSQWQSLTFLRIEFLTETFPADGLQLDNFVLQASGVPEPSVLAISGLILFTLFLARRFRSTA